MKDLPENTPTFLWFVKENLLTNTQMGSGIWCIIITGCLYPNICIMDVLHLCLLFILWQKIMDYSSTHMIFLHKNGDSKSDAKASTFV